MLRNLKRAVLWLAIIWPFNSAGGEIITPIREIIHIGQAHASSFSAPTPGQAWVVIRSQMQISNLIVQLYGDNTFILDEGRPQDITANMKYAIFPEFFHQLK